MMRRLMTVTMAAALLWGCGSGGAGPTTPARLESAETPADGQLSGTPGPRSVTAELRDALLSRHNASFFGGRTFRWQPPIPAYTLTGDGELDALLVTQFRAWEAPIGRTLFQFQPLVAGSPDTLIIPDRGILVEVAGLPPTLLGIGNPFVEFGERRRATALQRFARPLPLRRVEVPEVSGNGQIMRCLLTLNADLEGVVLEAVLRHEVGHCLGFIGHVPNPQSLMHASSCCPLTITKDVRWMMRRLYALPPGTRVDG